MVFFPIIFFDSGISLSPIIGLRSAVKSQEFDFYLKTMITCQTCRKGYKTIGVNICKEECQGIRRNQVSFIAFFHNVQRPELLNKLNTLKTVVRRILNITESRKHLLAIILY